MKKFRTAILIVTLIAMLTLIAHAVQTTREATLYYKDIKITLDGKEVIPIGANGTSTEPFIIRGTTYLPVRGIASILGIDVGWDGTTNTVKLSTPGLFTDAVTVYDDDIVTVKFAGCERKFSPIGEYEYYANFNVTNKTDVELNFKPTSLSFNGVSFNDFEGDDPIAPKSSGKVSFFTKTEIPFNGISKTSGQISFVGSSVSCEAKWVDVTQK